MVTGRASSSSPGQKGDAGKLRFDLIPPRSLQDLAHVYTIGAKKYADRNWEKGIAFGRIFGAMQRHAWAWWDGEELDQEDGQHHLAAVAWCAFTLLEYLRTHREFDDRPLDVLPLRCGECDQNPCVCPWEQEPEELCFLCGRQHPYTCPQQEEPCEST